MVTRLGAHRLALAPPWLRRRRGFRMPTVGRGRTRVPDRPRSMRRLGRRSSDRFATLPSVAPIAESSGSRSRTDQGCSTLAFECCLSSDSSTAPRGAI